MIQIFCGDNLEFTSDGLADLVFSDYVYESDDFRFITHFWNYLRPGGMYVAMTDHHTLFKLGSFMEALPNASFFSHLVWKNEWGNHPKQSFHQCFDNIVMFSKGKHQKFYPERIQVPKATAHTKLNPSGRMTKTATAWIDDVCLTTTSPERIKKADGHLVRWQKPLKLYDRIILPITDAGDMLLDTHMGSGSLAEWSFRNKRNYAGFELDADTYMLASARIKQVEADCFSHKM